MNQIMNVLAVCEVLDTQVLTINAATYKGSDRFSGNFRVWDLDHCYRKDDVTGQLFVTVFCGLDDDESEDAEIEFELHDFVHQGCEGFDGEVIRRIGFST